MTAHDIHTDLHTGLVPKPRDPRNLRLASYLTAELPAVPKRVNWLNKVPFWPIYFNDQVGDCEVAACAHSLQAFSTYGAGHEVRVTDGDVMRAYSAITGYDPQTGANDTGIATLDMLGYWRRTGLGGHRIAAYVEVDVQNRDEVRAALSIGCALLVGANLPLAAGDQFKDHRQWTVRRTARGQVGSWGGHAIHVGSYDSRGLTCTTWGTTQRLTWGWWDAYVMEAFVPIGPEWFGPAGTSPTGLNMAALLADLHQFTGH